MEQTFSSIKSRFNKEEQVTLLKSVSGYFKYFNISRCRRVRERKRLVRVWQIRCWKLLYKHISTALWANTEQGHTEKNHSSTSPGSEKALAAAASVDLILWATNARTSVASTQQSRPGWQHSNASILPTAYSSGCQQRKCISNISEMFMGGTLVWMCQLR